VKVRSEACPYDKDWEPYFEERKLRKGKHDLTLFGRVKELWQVQKGRCPFCHGDITQDTGWRILDAPLKPHGSKDILSNLQLLHPYCLRQLLCRNRKYVADPPPNLRGF
jgi:RNA-directed DNA polymerase